MSDDILGVAIKINELVVCLPKPSRHHDVIRYTNNILGIDTGKLECSINGVKQGFYDSRGNFLSRWDAWHRVKGKGLLPDCENKSGPLFSEDVW